MNPVLPSIPVDLTLWPVDALRRSEQARVAEFNRLWSDELDGTGPITPDNLPYATRVMHDLDLVRAELDAREMYEYAAEKAERSRAFFSERMARAKARDCPGRLDLQKISGRVGRLSFCADPFPATVSDVVLWTALSAQSVRRMYRSGSLSGFKIGRKILIYPSEICRLLNGLHGPECPTVPVLFPVADPWLEQDSH